MTENADNGAIVADELVAWFLRELPYMGWLKDEYVAWCDDGVTAKLNVDFEDLYRENFGMAYNHVLERASESFADMGLLVLLTWQALLKEDKRGLFVDEINLRLRAFDAPIRFTHKGQFHEIDPETVEYEDAAEYRGSRRTSFNVAMFIIVVFILLMMFLSMSLKITQSFIPPTLL